MPRIPHCGWHGPLIGAVHPAKVVPFEYFRRPLRTALDNGGHSYSARSEQKRRGKPVDSVVSTEMMKGSLHLLRSQILLIPTILGQRVKSTDSRARLLRFKSQLCHVVVMCPSANYVISVCLKCAHK